MDLTKSTAHSVENSHAWKRRQYFSIWRWFYRYRVLFDKVVSIVNKTREHAFIIRIWRYIWGHSCERYDRGRRVGTIAEICCRLFLSPLPATIRLIKLEAVIRSTRWRNRRLVHASYEYGWWLDAQHRGNICGVVAKSMWNICFKSCGGVRRSRLGTLATSEPTISAPDDR